MPWVAIGLLVPSPDHWVETVGMAEGRLIRITWLKGNAPLSSLKHRLLVRRKFDTGEVDQAKVCYPSNEPLVLNFDFNQYFQVQVKKIIRNRPIVSEPGFTLQIDYLF